MIFGIIPIFLLFCLYKAGCIRNGCSVDIFKALSFAACLWAVILFALTELLSLFFRTRKDGRFYRMDTYRCPAFAAYGTFNAQRGVFSFKAFRDRKTVSDGF